MKKRTKRTLATLTACAMLGAVAVGGTLAYLTDNETATNTFTIGEVTADLLEPAWPDQDGTVDTDDVTLIVPNQQIAKDPQIKNTGENDIVAFLKVTVPVAEVSLVADNGAVTAKAAQEIFYMKHADDDIVAHANNFDSNWIELESHETGADYTGTERTYVFGYNAPLAKEAVTNPLFGKVQLKNFLEDEIVVNTQEDIKINAYVIQADNILGANGLIDTAALDLAELTEIYSIFVTQMEDTDNPASEKDADTSNVEDLAGTALNANP